MESAINKENTVYDYKLMICKSWTYNRLTEEEKAQWENVTEWVQNQGMVKGTYKARWNIMNAIYFAFLRGVGYDNSMNWRER